MVRDYYVLNNGRIKRKDNTIYFIDKDENKRALPIEMINMLHIYGEIDFNTKFINHISSSNILMNFYNYYGYYTGTFYPKKKNVSGHILVNQAKHYNDFEKRMYLAKSFISSAKFHILKNLKYYDSVNLETINKIDMEELKTAKTIYELMGLEGRIRNLYYKEFSNILLNDFGYEKRLRPPIDPVNALISFGNSLMYTTVLGEIYKTQLDPTISYLHEPSTKRFSLSLDIAEIFKPLIVDPIIFSVINKQNIIYSDFSYSDGICMLNDKGRKKFIAEYEKKLSTTIKHRKLNRKVSYKGFIRLECYKLIKYFIGDEIYYPLRAWW